MGVGVAPVIERILDNAQRHGERIALLGNSARERMSYQELAQAIEALAVTLHGTEGHTLGLHVDNGIDWAIADLAALRAGLTTVPIPGFFSAKQIEHLLEDAGVDLLVCAESQPASGAWESVASVGTAARLLQRRMPQAATGAKITYTSGSSGTPKGVVLSAATIDSTTGAIVNALAALRPEHHLCLLPLATLLENIAGLYAPLCNGSTVELPSSQRTGLGSASLDIESFARLLHGSPADTLILVPQLLNALVTLCEMGAVTLGGLRFIAVGGGRVSRSLLDRAAALRLPVFEGYGLSECCSVLTLNLPGQQRLGSVGRPLPHASMRIGSSGEIEVRRPLMNGYLGASSEPAGWYDTGDLGHMDEDGFVYIDGRRRNMFVTSYGRNVNPEWIESALAQQVAVEQALAFGEAQPYNLALLWLRFEQSPAQLNTLIARVNAELPEYAQVHAVRVLDGSPPAELLTGNGRLKRALALDYYRDVIDAHYTQSATNLQKDAQHAVL